MTLRAVALALIACIAAPTLAQKPPAKPATAAAAPPVAIIDGDYTQGSPKAKITLTEYGAPTCPACKRWHDTVYVQIKRDYIDTGKVRFAFRELPSHNPPVDAAIFGLARCAAKDKYFAVLDEAFKRQAEIEAANSAPGGPLPALRALGAGFGVTAAKFNGCIDSLELKARITAVRQMAERDKVQGTPTVLIDGGEIELLVHDDYQRFRDMLDKAIAAKR